MSSMMNDTETWCAKFEHSWNTGLFIMAIIGMLSQIIIIGASCFFCWSDNILKSQITSHMVLVTDIYSDSIDDNAVAVVSYMTMISLLIARWKYILMCSFDHRQILLNCCTRQVYYFHLFYTWCQNLLWLGNIWEWVILSIV